MKNYDIIAVGTGSAIGVASAMLQNNPHLKLAVVDKDRPGGICLTVGCIPSKLLIYPADVVRAVQSARDFGIEAELKGVDFARVMARMRESIGKDIGEIHEGLMNSPGIDYYHATAEFIAPKTLLLRHIRHGPGLNGGEIQDTEIQGDKILLSPGSRPIVPPITGLAQAGFLTSDTLLGLERLPPTVAIIGGGYIAAEYGHFLSAMGSQVTILGKSNRFLPNEEPEISMAAERHMSSHMKILTGREVRSVEFGASGGKVLTAINNTTGKEEKFEAAEILVAAGRASNSDILHPERGGIATDGAGWIIANEYLETNQPGVWSFGDANGKHQFKHVANYESLIVYRNVGLGQNPKIKVDYSAVPHAVFCHPEIAAVGLGMSEAIKKFGDDNIRIGLKFYDETAKGQAMGVKDCFVKVILKTGDYKLLGAHIIGPEASVLIQELINLFLAGDGSAIPAIEAMHIHPALSEVVERALKTTMSVENYKHVMSHRGYRI